VCICTYRRPTLLSRLLEALQGQSTGNLFTFSVVVVDNDFAESAKEVVEAFKRNGRLKVDYYLEARKGIPLARNKAVENAEGNYLAFIDDDEIPVSHWLYDLYMACLKYNSAGILGPVKPRFEEPPPDWIVKCRLFERPSYETGKILKWNNTRTGNVLIRKCIIETSEDLFNPEFKHSEDQEFFRRMTEKGHVFVWCDEAIVHEIQTPDRFRRAYFFRRALLRGNVSLRLQSKKEAAIAKSTIAFSAYTLALPFLFLASQRLFITYVIKDLDHVGRLIAALGVDVQGYLA